MEGRLGRISPAGMPPCAIIAVMEPSSHRRPASGVQPPVFASLLLLATLATIATASAEDRAPTLSGTLDWVFPEGTSLSQGPSAGLTVQTYLDNALVGQVMVVLPRPEWNEGLHGLRLVIPETAILLPAKGRLMLHWWVMGEWNGKGPWLAGRLANPPTTINGSRVLLAKARTTFAAGDALPELPVVLPPAPVAPLTVNVTAAPLTVSCLVLKPKPSRKPDARRPGLIIAISGAPGDAAACRSTLSLWWADAPAQGWTVAAPVAQAGRLWHQLEAEQTATLIDALVAALDCDPARVVVAGCSNGGTAALTWTAQQPTRIAAALAFPGWLAAKAAGLKDKPILLRWGAYEEKGWKESVRQAASELTAAGAALDQAESSGSAHIVSVPGCDLLRWLADKVPAPAGQR